MLKDGVFQPFMASFNSSGFEFVQVFAWKDGDTKHHYPHKTPSSDESKRGQIVEPVIDCLHVLILMFEVSEEIPENLDTDGDRKGG